MKKILLELISYKQMIKSLVLSDLRTRYKGSVLGFLWTFLNPLLMLLVYTIVFSTIMRFDMPNYTIYMFIGLLPWMNFSSSILSSSSVIIRNSNLIKKIYFPHEVLPLSTVLGGIVNYLFGLIIMFIAIFISGMTISIHVLYFPVILFLLFLLMFALTLLFSSLNVYFRDLEHILGAIVMAWFYFTPVIYPSNVIPEKYQYLFNINPMKPIIDSLQDIFYYHRTPELSGLLQSFIYNVILLIVSWVIFRKLSRRFAEEV
ncbi:ABC transporter permease [Paenibacillus phytohabitans]|uniref:ABC transporter permease n=1 Tax=Paenibacillus phytohabitans TaxID=2654978 RepID=UPI003008D423